MGSPIRAHHVRWHIFRVAINELIGRFIVGTVSLASWCAVGAWTGSLVVSYGLLNDGCPDLDIRQACGWRRIVDGGEMLMTRATAQRQHQKSSESPALIHGSLAPALWEAIKLSLRTRCTQSQSRPSRNIVPGRTRLFGNSSPDSLGWILAPQDRPCKQI
jgi:hypothetical protein